MVTWETKIRFMCGDNCKICDRRSGKDHFLWQEVRFIQDTVYSEYTLHCVYAEKLELAKCHDL
jgi:hypothetical protein